jgi:hypothetical protein
LRDIRKQQKAERQFYQRDELHPAVSWAIPLRA